MTKLTMFSFPVSFDEKTDKLIPDAPEVTYEDYSRKFSKGMFGLLSDPSYREENDLYYDFYKAIGVNSDAEKFQSANLRHDSTVIMAGCAGDEFKKTAGHFHYNVPGKDISYPEYYQVVKGRSMFVMQKVADCHATGKMLVEDIILAEVGAGEAIVVPPGYGHCTVNISDETMVFINLVSCDSNNFYDSVKHSVGMCCYIKQDANGGYRVEKNPAYDFSCEPKIVTPCANQTLGIQTDVPVYVEFLRNPEKFAYLNQPEERMRDYFDVFKAK